MLPSSEALYWNHAYSHFFEGTFIERAIAAPSDVSGSILNHSNIRTDISNTGIMVIKEHKIFVALPESLYWKQAYFQVFDSTSIERTIAPPSDGSGSI